MSMIAGIAGMAVGTAGTIISNISGDVTKRRLSRLEDKDPSYTADPNVSQKYGLAEQLLNARMPGASQAQANIYGAQAQQQGSIERNATDGSQALAMGAANTANTDKAFSNLGMQEAGNYNNMLANYNQANQGMTDEHDKVYQDAVRKWQDSVNITMARGNISQGQGQNMVALGGSIMGAAGGMGGGSGGSGGGMGG
jgi:hypothetical protein